MNYYFFKTSPATLRCFWMLCVLPITVFIIFHNNAIDNVPHMRTTEFYFTNLSDPSTVHTHYGYSEGINATANNSTYNRTKTVVARNTSKYNITGIKDITKNITYNGTEKAAAPWDISNSNITKIKEIMKDDNNFRLNLSMTVQNILKSRKDQDNHHFSSYPNMDISDFVHKIVENSNVERCPKDTYLAVFVHIAFHPDTFVKVINIR